MLAGACNVLFMPNENSVKGGIARASVLDSVDRKAISARAAATRWGIPQAVSEGVLEIGDIQLECAVLPDGTRVIAQGKLQEAFGFSARGTRKEDLPILLSPNNLQPYMSEKTREYAKPISYSTSTGKRVGYNAMIVPGVCDTYLSANDASALTESQKIKALPVSVILVRSLANVGITALVDEATGYQTNRELDELQTLMKVFVREELRAWVERFPKWFFKEIFRIHGWTYNPDTSKRPGIVGTFINDYVYSQFPKEVVEEIKRRNPSDVFWRRPNKHHQYLTEEIGVPALDGAIRKVYALMQASDNKAEFDALFKKSMRSV